MVRVIIERRCKPDKKGELENLLIELRSKAMRQRGYVSGETLESADDPALWLTISTWADADLWKVWETMPERLDIVKKIQPLLVAPEKVSIFSFVRRGVAEPAYKVNR